MPSRASATVYLAGPIAGLSYDEATDWRHETIYQLAGAGIRGLSPMRAKQFLAGIERLDANDYQHPLASPSGVVARDRYDVSHCDMLIANLADAKTVSIGTMFEIAWADALRIPIVLVMDDDEKNCNPHNHAFVREIPSYWVDTLEEAVEIAIGFFAAG